MYVPEWERPDSPTRELPESAIAAYYKRHGAASDCRFALRPESTYPADLRAVWAALLPEVERRAPTPADRKLIEQLRAAWRDHIDGRAYLVPAFTAATKRRPAKATIAAAGCCPTCGQRSAAA